MDPRDDLRYLADMITYAEYVIRFMQGREESDLREDMMLQLAVVRAIEIIGEASRNVSEDTMRRWNAVPWPLIYGMRNRLAHDYGGIDLTVLHRVATDHLPEMLNQLLPAMETLQTELGDG